MILCGISIVLASMVVTAIARNAPALQSYDATAYECGRAALGCRRLADSPVEVSWFGEVSPAVDSSWCVVKALVGLRSALAPCAPVFTLGRLHELQAAA